MGAIGLTVFKSTEERAREGAYSICAGCPSHGNCCTRVRPGGAIDVPSLLPDDIKAIEKHSDKTADEFCIPNDGPPQLIRRMRALEGGCYFYRDGTCTIYSVRPTDCRLFPFDIIEKPDGRLVWVAYTKLCPVEHDPRSYFDQVKGLVRRLGGNIRAFARVRATGMEQQECIELGELEPE